VTENEEYKSRFRRRRSVRFTLRPRRFGKRLVLIAVYAAPLPRGDAFGRSALDSPTLTDIDGVIVLCVVNQTGSSASTTNPKTKSRRI
jgi:hypothetical protein